MPFMTFALLIGSVITAAGATIALFAWSGWPLGVVGIAALAISLLLRLRKRGG